MGYLKPQETDELRLPSNSDYWVRMKKKATYGDSRAAQSALLQVSQAQQGAGQNGNAPQMATEMELGAFIGTLTVRLIVDWNLTDDNDQPLDISLPNLDRLDDEDGEFLSLEAQKRKGGRPEDKQIPFQKESGRPSMDTKSKTRKLIE